MRLRETLEWSKYSIFKGIDQLLELADRLEAEGLAEHFSLCTDNPEKVSLNHYYIEGCKEEVLVLSVNDALYGKYDFIRDCSPSRTVKDVSIGELIELIKEDREFEEHGPDLFTEEHRDHEWGKEEE